jgi:hypothetical protein
MINEHEPLVALSPLAASVAEEDLSLARLSEGHTDALAILAELGAGPRAAGGWRHQALLLGRAVVHARAGDGGGGTGPADRVSVHDRVGEGRQVTGGPEVGG